MANQSLFNGLAPLELNHSDGAGEDATYELGIKFKSTVSGIIKQIKYYRSPSEIGSHAGKIWSSSGELLAQASFANESGLGWQEAVLQEPLKIKSNTIYTASVNINQYFVRTLGGLLGVIASGNLQSIADNNNGVFNQLPGQFPIQSFSNTNYFVDITFEKSEVLFENLGSVTPGDDWDTFEKTSKGELFRLSYIGNVDKFQGWLALRPIYRDGSIGKEIWIYPQVNTAIFESRIPTLMKSASTTIVREWQIKRRQKWRYNPLDISPIDVRLEEITEWAEAE